MLMALQDRDNVNVPLYEQQLREAETAISNLLGAIQQGILTRSTKARLEELENRRDELGNRLACEKLAKPKVSAEFMTFWLHRFRKLDVRQQSHRKMLIDAFINAIFLYDDKMVITFNYKEGTKTITFAELQEAISNKNGSDLDCLAAPKKRARQGSLFWCGRGSNPFNQQSCGLLVNAGWTAFTPYMNTSHWLFGPVGCVVVSVKLPHNLHLHIFSVNPSPDSVLRFLP